MTIVFGIRYSLQLTYLSKILVVNLPALATGEYVVRCQDLTTNCCPFKVSLTSHVVAPAFQTTALPYSLCHAKLLQVLARATSCQTLYIWWKPQDPQKSLKCIADNISKTDLIGIGRSVLHVGIVRMISLFFVLRSHLWFPASVYLQGVHNVKVLFCNSTLCSCLRILACLWDCFSFSVAYVLF